MYSLIRPLLFRLDAERAHDVVMATLAALSGSAMAMRAMRARRPRAARGGACVMGLSVANGIGLAAGLDKQARAFPALQALGFGWVEVGTVTPRPQAGNPRPRLFRLREDRALVNRMGFNSVGVERFIANLASRRRHCDAPLGINIGKNAATPVADAEADYLHALEQVYGHADYVAVNISSPNTESLRTLQHSARLERFIDTLLRRRDALADRHGRRVPLAFKLAPDLADHELAPVCAVLRGRGVDGVIATNTTVQRPARLASPAAAQAGGLSGRPLEARATRMVGALHAELGGQIPIIGVGGVEDPTSLARKLAAGAVAVQCYTAFIYQGPGLARRLAAAFAQH